MGIKTLVSLVVAIMKNLKNAYGYDIITFKSWISATTGFDCHCWKSGKTAKVAFLTDRSGKR